MTYEQELARLRTRVDAVDRQLIQILLERFELTGRIALLKTEAGVPGYDPTREDQIYKGIQEMGERKGLEIDEIEALKRLYEVLLRESKANQERYIKRCLAVEGT